MEELTRFLAALVVVGLLLGIMTILFMALNTGAFQ